mgnify:CR=1 FL=1
MGGEVKIFSSPTVYLYGREGENSKFVQVSQPINRAAILKFFYVLETVTSSTGGKSTHFLLAAFEQFEIMNQKCSIPMEIPARY